MYKKKLEGYHFFVNFPGALIDLIFFLRNEKRKNWIEISIPSYLNNVIKQSVFFDKLDFLKIEEIEGISLLDIYSFEEIPDEVILKWIKKQKNKKKVALNYFGNLDLHHNFQSVQIDSLIFDFISEKMLDFQFLNLSAFLNKKEDAEVWIRRNKALLKDYLEKYHFQNKAKKEKVVFLKESCNKIYMQSEHHVLMKFIEKLGFEIIEGRNRQYPLRHFEINKEILEDINPDWIFFQNEKKNFSQAPYFLETKKEKESYFELFFPKIKVKAKKKKQIYSIPQSYGFWDYASFEIYFMYFWLIHLFSPEVFQEKSFYELLKSYSSYYPKDISEDLFKKMLDYNYNKNQKHFLEIFFN